jgi:DNA-binding NarL/FixJ family response regulator
MAAGRVLLADDHPLFRDALCAAVSRIRPDFEISQVESLDGARRVLLNGPVALVLLDLKLQDCEGLVGLLTLRAEFPQAPIVVVSASEDPATVSDAIATGALGFIPKSASMATMSTALEVILGGDVWTPEDLVLAAPSKAVLALASLSPAQARIIACLGRGLPNKLIAHELGITEATVKAHMTATFRKLGVVSRTQALLLIGSALQSTSSTSA